MARKIKARYRSETLPSKFRSRYIPALPQIAYSYLLGTSSPCDTHGCDQETVSNLIVQMTAIKNALHAREHPGKRSLTNKFSRV